MDKTRRKYQKVDRACRVSVLLVLFTLFVALPVYASTTGGVTVLGTPQMTYTLTVGSSDYGNVSAPGEGVFTYNISDEVNLVAFPNWHYMFTGWTGDIEGIADVNESHTTILMLHDYNISANFEYDPNVIPAEAQAMIDLTGTIISVVIAAGMIVGTVGIGYCLFRAGNLGGALGVGLLGIVAIIIIEALMGAFK